MNIYKNISITLSVAFLLSGCNVYRQMTLPTPYYPEGSTQNDNVVTDNESTTVSGTLSTDGNSYSSTNQSEGSITPVKNTEIKTENKTIVPRIPFPESEYNNLPRTGYATVKGSIYITTAGGNKVIGKNTRLYLNPVTSYSTQWYNESYLGGAKMSKVDDRLFNYLKFTTSKSDGNFEFLNVPKGEYYLIGVVKCGTACGYDRVKNIRITKKISVSGNKVQNIDLSKQIQ